MNVRLHNHCSSHCFNLAVVSTCEDQRVKNLMKRIKEISYFFNLSGPCTQCLKNNKVLYAHEYLKIKLFDIYRAKKVKRIDDLNTLEERFVPVTYSLLAMKENSDSSIYYSKETSAKVDFLFKLIGNFEFLLDLL